jgi:hypothetical protein
VQRTIVLSSAVVFGLCGTAFAKPDWDKVEHLQGIRGEVRMKMQTDGRGFAQERGPLYNKEPRAAEKARPEDYSKKPSLSQLPFKSQIALKMQNGGEGRANEDAAQKNAQQPKVQETRKDLRPGPSMAGLPLKTAIAMKMQNGGEGKAEDTSNKQNQQQQQQAQKNGNHISPTVNGQVRPLSTKEKESLCKHTGVCLSDLMSSDDPADKVE